MIVLSVLYPRSAETYFDMDYYKATHMPLVVARWTGLGIGKALDAHGAEIMGDVPNFTNIAPALQINEAVF